MPLDPNISLQVTPIQFPDPLANYGKLMTLKHLISQDQVNQLAMQEAQRKLGGEMTMADLMRQAYSPQQVSVPQYGPTPSGAALPPITGTVPGTGDLSQIPAGLAQAGYGNMVPAYQKQMLEMQQAQTNLGKTQADAEKSRLEAMSSKADILAREVNPLLKKSVITPEDISNSMQNLSSNGFDLTKVEPPKDTSPESLRAWVQHASDSAISMKERATIEHQNAVLAEQKRRTDLLYGSDSTGETPESLKAAAERYRIDGSLPTNMGRGIQGARQATAIRNLAAELDAADNIPPDEARIRQLQGKATTGALNKLSSQETMVGAFEKTFNKNVDLVLEQSKKVDRTGTPIVNKWLLAGKRQVAGDPEVSSFDLYIKAAVNEYSKIVSGSMGNTALAQSEISKVTSLLSAAQTDAQVMKVVDSMKRETANRMNGFKEQKDALKASLGRNKPVPNVSSGVPDGVDPNLWQHMTPEEQKLWQ